ncbi:hypothetical protein HDU98_003931 [Podochytrium sp. JEL0797]|nr:hypothetical protein HDU98_003931 [Podochytrium sp. JEL0797]
MRRDRIASRARKPSVSHYNSSHKQPKFEDGEHVTAILARLNITLTSQQRKRFSHAAKQFMSNLLSRSSATNTITESPTSSIHMDHSDALRRGSIDSDMMELPELAPPAEQDALESYDPQESQPAPELDQESPSKQGRGLRRRDSAPAVLAVPGMGVAEVNPGFVPFEVLDDYSFWAFDELERMGISLRGCC